MSAISRQLTAANELIEFLRVGITEIKRNHDKAYTHRQGTTTGKCKQLLLNIDLYTSEHE